VLVILKHLRSASQALKLGSFFSKLFYAKAK